MLDNSILKKIEIFCNFRERCESEVVYRLKKENISSNDAKEYLKKLKNDKFYCDIRYTSAFVRSKFNLSKWGKTKIRLKLLQNKIEDSIIKKEIDKIEHNIYAETIKELVEKKLRKIKNRSDFEKKQLVSRYLYSKGYEPEKFISIINKNFNWL